MFAQGEHIIRIFESIVPPRLAVPNDKIGLQVGTLRKEVKKVMLALDVTPEVVEEAVWQHVDLIIAHHAPIYRPLSTLRTDTVTGRVFEKLIKHDIAVYVAHTNWDIAQGGINDILAEKLALKEAKVLSPVHVQSLKKFVVFVPESAYDQVFKALGETGAGWIGNYSHCTFNIRGTGTFKPNKEANPFIGTKGKIERVDEVRIETVVSDDIVEQVLEAVLEAHPYEEVAYDLYPLDLPSDAYGLGRYGKLTKPESFADFVDKVKQAFNLPALRAVGDPDRTVRTVALLAGSGAKYLSDAIRVRADVYITGDIDYHTAQDARAAGIALIDPGHHVEYLALQPMREYLSNALVKTNTVVTQSEVETNPFFYV